MAVKKIFDGVHLINERLFTKNLVPGRAVYGERLLKVEGTEYRAWEPFRSKLAAAIKKGLHTWPFHPGTKVLYLGAASGTTVSHISDIIGEKGEIYAVEISPHPTKALLKLSDYRKNIIPISADARKPADYSEVGRVDAIYEDVAHPEQAEILIANSKMFLRKDGIAMIAIKSQSIDVVKQPKDVFDAVLTTLTQHFEILEKINIEYFHKGHLFVVLRKK